MKKRKRNPRRPTTIMSHVMLPEDANPAGNVHGGVVMKHVDNAAGVTAMRHARSNVVTASIERLDFHFPMYIGDLLVLKASLNAVNRTSMEVGVRVEAEDLMTGDSRHTASAYLTFVALDEAGRPRLLPDYKPETEDERRRHCAALERMRIRKEERWSSEACRKKRHDAAAAPKDASDPPCHLTASCTPADQQTGEALPSDAASSDAAPSDTRSINQEE